ncbi:MAG: hypothetical protein HYS27_23970 [Deltaproteobacteria bacterium]|nr:hypothetical protein [Deltaproteobacteria bacterium]
MTHINGKLKLARDINRFIEASGGQAIRGLENLPQEQLMEVGGALSQAFDQFQRGAMTGDANRMMAGQQAISDIRNIAEFASRAIDQEVGGLQSASNQGFCNGASNPLRNNEVGEDEPQSFGALQSPSRIGDDMRFGNDEMGEALRELGSGGCFEDRVFALMCKVVKDFQKKIEERLNKLSDQAKQAEGKKNDKGQESRNIEFEKIKFDMQKLSQMQQAMSNVLNTMDELAKSAIRHIKAG